MYTSNWDYKNFSSELMAHMHQAYKFGELINQLIEARVFASLDEAAIHIMKDCVEFPKQMIILECNKSNQYHFKPKHVEGFFCLLLQDEYTPVIENGKVVKLKMHNDNLRAILKI